MTKSRRPGARIAPASERDAGMTTAEYAVGTVAAAGFGGILYKVVTSTQVVSWLTKVISRALNTAF